MQSGLREVIDVVIFLWIRPRHAHVHDGIVVGDRFVGCNLRRQIPARIPSAHWCLLRIAGILVERQPGLGIRVRCGPCRRVRLGRGRPIHCDSTPEPALGQRKHGGDRRKRDRGHFSQLQVCRQHRFHHASRREGCGNCNRTIRNGLASRRWKNRHHPWGSNSAAAAATAQRQTGEGNAHADLQAPSSTGRANDYFAKAKIEMRAFLAGRNKRLASTRCDRSTVACAGLRSWV